MILDNDINIGTESNGTEGLRELEINVTGSLEHNGMEDILRLSILSHLISRHENVGHLSSTGSITNRVESRLSAFVSQGKSVGDSLVNWLVL